MCQVSQLSQFCSSTQGNGNAQLTFYKKIGFFILKLLVLNSYFLLKEIGNDGIIMGIAKTSSKPSSPHKKIIKFIYRFDFSLICK